MKTQAQFIQALQESQTYVNAVASWMAMHDCDVVIKPTLIAPSTEVRHEYIDSGDIEIRQRVEVKHISIGFTCAEDFPYPTIIVDEVHKVDRIPRGQLWGYVIVNEAGTHVCCLRADTKGRWTIQRRHDKKEGAERAFYVCPVAIGMFCALPAKVINEH
jgi:hypothetical protein